MDAPLDPAHTADSLLRTMLTVFSGRIAAVSSFGAESAVLLHILAQIDPAVPVIFLDTGKLFPETLAYRDALVRRLGLTDVRVAHPDLVWLVQTDAAGTLWQKEPDLCCWNRKVEPLEVVLTGFAAWITGRKRMHGGERRGLDMIDAGQDGRIKANPLVAWSSDDIAGYFTTHDLPRHPLLAYGYRSIGCMPCTRPIAPDHSPRAGRWFGEGKTECGIHRSLQSAYSGSPRA